MNRDDDFDALTNTQAELAALIAEDTDEAHRALADEIARQHAEVTDYAPPPPTTRGLPSLFVLGWFERHSEEWQLIPRFYWTRDIAQAGADEINMRPGNTSIWYRVFEYAPIPF